MRILLLLSFVLAATALVVAPVQDELDEVAVVQGSMAPMTIMKSTAYLYGAITLLLSPLVDPALVSELLGALHLPGLLRQIILALCRPLHAIRSKHTLAVLLTHEVITDVTADVMAQSFAAHEAGVRMAIDWKRVPKSTLASLLSDDFPFLIWSRYIWIVGERAVLGLRASDLNPGAHATAHTRYSDTWPNTTNTIHTHCTLLPRLSDTTTPSNTRRLVVSHATAHMFCFSIFFRACASSYESDRGNVGQDGHYAGTTKLCPSANEGRLTSASQQHTHTHTHAAQALTGGRIPFQRHPHRWCTRRRPTASISACK